jgi:glycosyltransferase involved in cell wall biosynthesis
MNIAFCHHLSLKYGGGGEKWVIQLANELRRRGHHVEVYSLPFQLKDGNKLNPIKELNDVPYHEGYFHSIEADAIYVTYNPLNWLNFWIRGPKIGGMHSHAYWMPINPRYGTLPNLAIITNALTSRWELARFKTIHVVTDAYPVNHRCVKYIPNFVDSHIYHTTRDKEKEFTIAYASRKVWQKGYDVWAKIKAIMNDEVNFVETGKLTESELVDCLSSSHVLVVPSRVDTFGLSIVEAAMCGLISVTSPLLSHRALGLPLFYGEDAADYVDRIREIKQMWETGTYDAYVDVLRSQAMRFDKKLVVDELESMFVGVADS